MGMGLSCVFVYVSMGSDEGMETNRGHAPQKEEVVMKKWIVLLVAVFMLSAMPVMAELPLIVDEPVVTAPVTDVPPVTKIENRMSELEAQAKTLTDKRTQLQNGLVQIDQQLLMIQGAYNELVRQKGEYEQPQD